MQIHEREQAERAERSDPVPRGRQEEPPHAHGVVMRQRVCQLHEPPGGSLSSVSGIMLLLSAAYVFGCAFRSFLPRADVRRICLFDT